MTALLLAAVLSVAPPPAPQTFIRERLGNHAIAQLYAPQVEALSLNEKRVLFHLSLAAHAGEPIAYDQNGWKGLAVKKMLEGVYLFGLEGKSGAGSFDQRFTEHLKKFYGHMGNHDAATGQKFLPSFTAVELETAALRALKAGAPLAADETALKAELAALAPTLFDAAFEPQLTSKNPPPGKDILTASSNTAYGQDVTLKDLEGFREKNALNSRVVKRKGKLEEHVFRAGTPDGKIPSGLYAEELKRVIDHVRQAAKHAPKDQRAALEKLARYFQTGDLKDWDAYNIAWLRSNPTVDANLGFIETYVDARGQKGAWEGLINYTDAKENRVMELMAQKAQYFENRMPWPEKYRRKKIRLPVAKAIALVTAYPQPPAGINLPNEQHIREKYGSKSVLVSNTMEAAAAVKRLPLSLEFSRTEEERELAKRHSAQARKWLVAFHEVAGHASGQVDPKLGKTPPSALLKEYDNTLEEARADLVALWHAFDPALATLSPEHTKVAEQMYRDFVIDGLTNHARVEKGDEFEEDHQRGHHMTVGVLMEKGAVKQVVENNRTYWVVTDFPKMRQAVGELLSQLMVIKATGDYAGIQSLVQKYGQKFDPKLRDEVASRIQALQVPTVTLMTSPRIRPVLGEKGELVNLLVNHEQEWVNQHLERSVLGRMAPEEAARWAADLDTTESLRQAWLKTNAQPQRSGATAPSTKTGP